MSAAKLAKAAIKIPQRIQRGPTDILKALSATVKFIPSEPDYVLHDDPYLLPRRPADFKRFSLSKLQGAKSARYFLNKYPEIFFRDDAEPKIEAYATPEQFNQEMDFTEDDIKWCIKHQDITNGIIAYNSLVGRDVELTEETLLQFFELLCFTNEEGNDDYLNHESKWLADEKEYLSYTWRTSGLASKIFNKIKEDTDAPRVYSAMIAGLVKFNEHEGANQLFEDFKNQHEQESLFAIAYESLLRTIPKVRSSKGIAMESVNEIVSHMEAHSVEPTLGVFNAILHCYRSYSVDDSVCDEAFKLFNDMKTLGIEPSLESYAELLVILTKNKYASSHKDILEDVIEQASLVAGRYSTDSVAHVSFLVQAMYYVANRLNDLKLAHRVHRIYLKNPRLFLLSKERARYFNNYFKLIITTDTLDNIIKFYNLYVPSIFCPLPDCYEALAEVLDLYQAPDEVVEKIGQDIIKFRLCLKIKNDEIFRKNPEYMAAVEKFINESV